MTKPNPVIVEVTRGIGVESWHSGSAVVVKADGNIVAAWGEIYAISISALGHKAPASIALDRIGAPPSTFWLPIRRSR